MAVYLPAPGSRINEEQAQRYGNFIEEFCDENGGVSPETLVAHRDDPRIADYFWEEDEVAAYKFRLEKAGHLLRVINVKDSKDGNEFVTRAFYPVTVQVIAQTDNEDENEEIVEKRVYRPTISILTIPEQREEVFQDVLKRFREMRDKYKHFKELKEVFEAIDKL